MPIKLVKMRAENIKRIKEVEITPDGNLVQITGKNSAGKSSLLDSIMYALAGGRSIPKKAIREGAEKGVVTIDLNDLIVTRTITEKGSYLKVEAKDGAQYPKAQEKLDNIVGALSFDPLEFSQMDAKKQRELLLELVGLNTEEIDSERQEVFDRRTDVRRDLKRLQAEADAALERVPEDMRNLSKEPEEIVVSSSMQKLAGLQEELRQYNQIEADLKDTQREIADRKERIEELRKQVEVWESKEARLLKEKANAEKSPSELEREIEVVKKEIDSSDTHNGNVRAYREAKKLQSRVKDLDTEVAGLTGEIEELDDEKQKLIESAEMPVEGLGFDADGVTYNGIPFTELSASEKLRISVAMGMAMNPELRLILVRDGSLLDADNLEVIKEMAEKDDYMVIIEMVADNAGVGFYLEDGELKASA